MTVSTLDRLRAAITDRAGLAPVSRAVGVELIEVDPGRVRARLPSAAVLPGPGAVLVLADFVLGAAIGTRLPVGLRVSTLSIHASLLAPPEGALTAVGDLVHLDAGVSRAEVVDGDGRPVATLTSRCATLAAAGAPPGAQDVGGSLRLRGTADGVVATADPALANFGSTVQGGILATVLAHALDATDGELDVTYLRAVPADGATFTARARPEHTGRRFTAARGELHDAHGRLAAIATASRWRSDPARTPGDLPRSAL